MINKDLERLGLSPTESTLYLALLKLGVSDVQSLIQETNLYKSNIYQSLERLIEKGLVSKVLDSNKRIYQIQEPRSLIDFIEKKKHEIEIQEQIARDLSKKVKIKKKELSFSETASVMRGIPAVKQVFNEIIELGKDYIAFGAPRESEIMGDLFWQNIHLRQHHNNIKVKMIFHKSLQHWKRKVRFSNITLKFQEEDFEPITETVVYGNKTAIIVWEEKPIVTIIINKHVSDSYRQIFEVLWKNASK